MSVLEALPAFRQPYGGTGGLSACIPYWMQATAPHEASLGGPCCRIGPEQRAAGRTGTGTGIPMRTSTGTDQVLPATGVGAGAALVTGMVVLGPMTPHSAWATIGGRIVATSDPKGSHVPPAISQVLGIPGQVPRAAAPCPTAAAVVSHSLDCPGPRLHLPGAPNQQQPQQQVCNQQHQVWQVTTRISLAAQTTITSTTWLVPRCPTL